MPLPRSHRPGSSRLALGPLLLVATACGGGDAAPDPEPSAVVTDSAGVRVVTHTAPRDWAFPAGLREELRLGRTEGASEALFSVIAGGLILPDGRIVLADRDASEVRQFDAHGTLLKVHGGHGEGPGEYEYIRGMAICDPSGFTVFDLHWGMGLYDADGDFVGERPVRIDGGQSPYNLACDASGRLAVANWDMAGRAGGPPQGLHTAVTRLRVLDAEGAEVLDLGERIGSERWGTPGGSRPHPAGRATRFGFQGDDLVVSDGSFFGYERWSPEGELTEIVRIDVPPPNVDSLAAAYLDATLAAAPDEEYRRRLRQQVEAMEWPERAAFFSDLVVTDDRILLQEVSFGGRGRWFVFSADGTPRGYLPLPEGARLLDFRGDRVLVEERTELDVPQAVLYRIAPGGA